MIVQLTDLQKRLLNDFQRNFPLSPQPYAEIATQLGVTEEAVLQALSHLTKQQFISRIGAIIPPNQIGVSTLAAMAVPENELEYVAAQINQFSEVNHNYERENTLNLWFVIIANDAVHLNNVLQLIETQTGYNVLRFPLEKEFFIDLSFRLDLTNA